MSQINNSNELTSNWLKCAHWLNDLRVFTEKTLQKISENKLTEEEFDSLISDGLCLIKLLDILSPSSQQSSSNNIETFLKRCRSAPFHMTEQELFESEYLSDESNVTPVIRSLSILSQLNFVKEKSGHDGFYFNEENFENEAFVYDDGVKSCDYQDWAPWLLGMSARDLTHELADSSSSYISADEDLSLFNENLKAMTIDKYLYTIREIVSTEEKFLALMRALMEDFLQPLSTVMTPEEKRATNINIQALFKLHTDLYAELHAACLSEANRTKQLCKVFSSYQKRFMKEYVDYFVNIENAIESFNTMIKRSNNDAFARTYDSCRANFKYQQCSITLSDLLLQPFQRISKYHLLMKDLCKNRQSNPELRECIEECVKKIEATGTYLNEAKRDHECTMRIERTFGALNLPPKLDMGRLVKESSCNVGIFKNDTDALGSSCSKAARTVLLFETSLLIYKRNLFQRYEKVEEFSVYEIKSVKQGVASSVKSCSNSLPPSPEPTTATFLTLLFQPDTNNIKHVEFHFKTSSENEAWYNAFSLIRPLHRLARNHVFILSNFDRDIKECGVCHSYMNGLFFQGFKCKFCEINVHRQCLSNEIETCKDNTTSKTEHTFRPGTIRSCKSSRGGIFQQSINISNGIEKQSKGLIFRERKPSFIGTAIGYCKSISEYKDTPKPPLTGLTPLSFESGEIIWIIESNEADLNDKYHEWKRGYKLRFNGSLKDLPLYKEEGYFPLTHAQYVDAKECLEIYSWYLNEDQREYAINVLMRAISSDVISNKNLFLLRPSKSRGGNVRGESSIGHSISFTHHNKVCHIKVNKSVWLKSRMKNMGMYFVRNTEENNQMTSEMTKFYDINNQAYFLSLVDLIDYYKENPLEQFLNGQVTSLGVSFREAMPTPLYVAKVSVSVDETLKQRDNMLELRMGERCFVVKGEDEHGWVYAFNVNGLLGYVRSQRLEEIF